MAITAQDKKISSMTEVAPSGSMFVPLVDLSQPDAADRNVRATISAILALVPDPAFADITGKPTTLAGYGITDGITAAAVAASYQPLDADLTAIASLGTTAYGRGFLTLTDQASALAYIGAGSGSGTVTSVSVVSANGVSGSVATATTTPAITLTLGAITPTSIAASGSISGSNLSGTNTGDQSSVTGNAGTATALQTARNINGVSFNGTADIVITAAAGTLTGATLAANITASSLLSAAGGAFGTAAFTDASAYQPIDADLTALAALSSTGYPRRTGVNTWTQDALVPTTFGGTGFSTYSEGDILYGVTGGTLAKLSLGTIGNILAVGIGGPAWGDITTMAVTALTGTANQVIVSGSTGPVTLTLPQNIHTGSAPQFARLGLGDAADATAIINAGSAVAGDAFEFWGQSAISGTQVSLNVTMYDTGTGSGTTHWRHARGTKASPSAILLGDGVGAFGFKGYTGAAWSGSAVAMHVIATEDFSATNTGARARILTTPAGGVTRYPFYEFTDIGVLWTHGQSSSFDPLNTVHFRPATDTKVSASESGAGCTFSTQAWGGDSGYRAYAAGGTVGAPTATPINRLIGFLSAAGHDGSGWTGSKGLASFQASENWGGSANGVDWLLGLTPSGSTTRNTVLSVRGTGVAEFTNYIHVTRAAGAAVEELRLAIVGASAGDGAAINFLHSTTERSGRIYARALSTNVGEVRIASGDAAAYTDVANFAAGAVEIYGTVKTAAPSGGTAQPIKFGSIVPAASALDATRYVEAEINGLACKLALIS